VFGQLIQSLAAFTPLLTTGGNHEVGFGEAWISYQNRYPTPYKGSDSTNFCYWGREVGVVNVIALCSYSGFSETSMQFAWLQHYLATRINRERTPWVLVMMHTPWYNSNKAHWMEGELMRRSMEPLLYQYGVDIVLSGHVHSYERSYGVFNNSLDECGPVYLNLGDGGNYEAATQNWRFTYDKDSSATGAPLWSAFRESSFGVGSLVFENATAAEYSWHRHACGSDVPGADGMNFSDTCVTPGDLSPQNMLTSDVAKLLRPSRSSCPNRYVSTNDAVLPPEVIPEVTTASASTSDSETLLVIGLSVGCGLLGLCAIVLAIALHASFRSEHNGNSAESSYKLLSGFV
jgi:hypothetical protein